MGKKTKGRLSGGVAVLFKHKYKDGIPLLKSTCNFSWCKIKKNNLSRDVYLCATYVPSENSRYYTPDLFEDIEKDIEVFSTLGHVLVIGDFNARTGKREDYIPVCSTIINGDVSHNSFIPPISRNNYNNVLNNHGKNC